MKLNRVVLLLLTLKALGLKRDFSIHGYFEFSVVKFRLTRYFF